MTRTRNEWLDSLDWHDGPPLVPGPPEDPIYGSLRTPPEPRSCHSLIVSGPP